MRSEYKDFHVMVEPSVYIHTILLEPTTPPPEPVTPLVMIHGFGCGIPQYYKNYGDLHSSRQVYGIDLPGYGRSTRVHFSEDGEANENLFVEYLEKWRVAMGIEKFILLGHSFGAYLSSAYAIKYQQHVRHLVLNDPWGFTVRLEEMESGRGKRFPMWITAVAMVITKFNPFTPIRVAGPAGELCEPLVECGHLKNQQS
jgi:pimeloyl-ACP methyl ester carboxylesterase